jgi:hypothetical protein
LVLRACGRGPLPRTLGPGGHDERPSSESSLLVAASGGRAGAKRSRPERPALSKSAVGPARDCGPPGSGAPLEPQLIGCCAGVRSNAGVGSRARSSPLPSGPPSGPAICASTRPCTRKSKRSVTADVLEKLLHSRVLERFVDVRDHALLLLPLFPAGGAIPLGCGQDGAVVLVGSPGVSR